MLVSRKALGACVAVIGTSLVAAAPVNAATVLTFNGVAALGSVNGVNFSNQAFSLEFEVDSSRTFAGASAPDTIVGGTLTINNQRLELVGASRAGRVSVNVSAGGDDIGDAISVNPASGGFVSFLVADNALFPSTFTGTTLGSLEGLSAVNTTTDPFNNGPAVDFREASNPSFGEGGLPATSLLTTGGPVNLRGSSAFGNVANGLWSFSAAAVPEPTSMLATVAGSALLLRRRKN